MEARVKRWIAVILAMLALWAPTRPAHAQELPGDATEETTPTVDTPTAANPSPAVHANSQGTALLPGVGQLPDSTRKENFSAAMQIIILLTVLSLAPAILIMMTSFTRIIIVLSLLRQALGTQQLPPNQVLMGLALFMTCIVMGPTWQRIYGNAVRPYMDGTMDQKTALVVAQVPLREFMEGQIRKSGNEADVLLFTEFSHQPEPRDFSQVGTMTLIPAFMLSELKTAFLLGFKVYLPFLIIDMVISAVLISMGMMMLPPVLISLPFKLLLFVLVDGWRLITGSLMGSFMA